MNGLILAGGYSTRMGRDKSMIKYHGVPQYQYIGGLLRAYTDEVFISCRPEQQFDSSYARIEDQFENIGPLAGVLSAFQQDAENAWWVIAIDFPYINHGGLSFLYSVRDPHRQATYFIDSETHLPEPLLTIFEPSILPVLLSAYHAGQFSLNKILQSIDGNGVPAGDPQWIVNINS